MVKKHLFLSLLCLASAAALTGCHEDLIGGKTDKAGTIFPSVSVNSKVEGAPKSSVKGLSRAEYNQVTAADLALKITSADGSMSKTWESVAQFDTNEEYAIGDYLVEASYGDVETEGFGCPAFYGSANITVLENQETPVTLTASLVNSMLTIKYTDEFKRYMTEWDATAHSAGGDYIFYAADEARPAYMRPGATTVSVRFVKPNGQEGNIEVANFTAVARHHYTLTVNVSNTSGDASLIISYDDSLEQEDVTIDISDEVMNAPAPEVKSENVTNGQIFKSVEGSPLDSSLKLNVIAKGGMKSVVLTTQSVSLDAQGWPEEVDLLNLTDAQKQTLTSLGFKGIGLWSNPDKMAVLDFSAVAQYLTRMTTNNTTSFQVVVKDAYGKVSEPFAFAITLDELTLELGKIEDVAYGATSVNVDLEYNGADPAKDVIIQYKNDRGTWNNTTFTVVSGPEARSGNVYKLNVAIPEATADVQLRASAANGKYMSETCVVPVDMPDFSLSVADNDVWATKVYPAIECVAASAASMATYYVSTDGTNYTSAATSAADGAKVVTGLIPGTKYWLKASLSDDINDTCAPVTFTTEAAAQLPNASLETSSVSESGSYWKRYEYEGWGTNNTMTTNAGAAYAYVRISGTIPTTDSKSGNAVLLRTCGWGSGNTAAGSKGTSGVCKYTDPGLLHLGTNRTSRPSGYSSSDNVTNSCSTGPITTDDLAPLGISFASRPASMNFYYKYSPKNTADKGYAEVTVMDVEGNVVATKTLLLSAASSYTLATVVLDYPAKAPKAGKIYVKFLSSYDAEYIKRTDNNFSGPGFGNLSNGTFMGSQLYIDEISLNY